MHHAQIAVYIAGGTCVLGLQYSPAKRARPHLGERTYDAVER